MFKQLMLVVLGTSILTACATPVVRHADTLADPQVLNTTAISAGACDDLGQLIRPNDLIMAPRLQASAAPKQ